MFRLMRRGSRLFLLSMILIILLFLFLGFFVSSGHLKGDRFSEEKGKVKIYLEHTRFFADENQAIHMEGNRLIIKEGGDYQLSGIMDDGQIIVDVGKDQEVTLKLDSVDITCKKSSPLFVKSADKVVLKLKKGSKNYFRDGTDYEEVPDGEIQPRACIDSREDLNIKGSHGFLTVEGNYKHGICSSDDLKIKSGTIEIYAKGTALKGKDSVQISGGNIKIDAGKDGIYSGQMVKAEKGKLVIKSARYGIFGREELYFSPDCPVTIEGALSPVAGNHFATLPESIQILGDGDVADSGR